MFKRIMIAVAVAACATAAAAQAEDLNLKFGDLDLSQPAQVRVLDQRIDRVAKQWCSTQIQTGSTLTPAGCEREARSSLMHAMPAATLKAYKVGMSTPLPTVQASIPTAQPAVR